MTVILPRRPAFQTGGISGSPKLDLGGCVLYLPLWRQDQVDSPFLSSGVYGIPRHLCTVVGAPTWGNRGRTFDAIDDLISIPNAASLQTTGAFTILLWLMIPTASASNGYIASKRGDANFQWHVIAQPTDKLLVGTTATNQEVTNTISRDVYYFLAWGRDAAGNGFIDIDGVSDWTGALGAQVSNTIAITLNCRNIIAGGYTSFTGCSIGEFLLYSRALSLSERTRVYLETKWRFGK